MSKHIINIRETVYHDHEIEVECDEGKLNEIFAELESRNAQGFITYLDDVVHFIKEMGVEVTGESEDDCGTSDYFEFSGE